MGRPIALALLCVSLLAVGCGDDDSEDSAGTAPEAARTEPSGAEGECKRVEPPAPREEGDERRPRKPLSESGSYEARITTSCGSFTITLDQKTSPKTAASFANLVKSGFYDDTVFHRIVPGFVIQGGDPTGSGSGGPGYSVVDKPPGDAKYTKGVVAMAKTQAEKPGTSGSQFYVVTGADAGLPPEYAILGKVTKGQDVVDAIGRLGDPTTEQPTQPVVLEKATLEGP